jgi:hypothetical protein
MRLDRFRGHPRITATVACVVVSALVVAGCTTAPRSDQERPTGRLDPRALTGWWVAELTSQDGEVTYGLAQAEETAAGGVCWKVALASGGAAILEGQPPEGVRMTAVWIDPAAGDATGSQCSASS